MSLPADLNPAQRDAVTTLAGPLLVLAGAGTGKTRVVTYRIAELIRHRTRPSRILAVTFTNKAAGEMQQRAGALLGNKKSDEKPEISTFHSLCVRVLRRNIRQLGYPEKFAIYDRGDQESVARAALREIQVPSTLLRPSDLIYFIGNWKMRSLDPSQAASLASTDKEHMAAMAYRRYQTSLKNAGAVDFDDLLLLTERLFMDFADVREKEAGRFDHLLVDEYQDTNGSQYRIIKALAGGHRNLCVVGDDDQSIYGWRGAEVTHILQFQRDWPEAKVVRLEDNYRSMAPIIEMANRLIVHNRHRHDKVLRPFREGDEQPRVVQYPDEAAEAREIVAEIGTLIEKHLAEPRDLAILFRTNEQPRLFELELRRAKLPYTLIGGMSFYDRKEVRDILAYMKLLVQPRDEVSLLRVINTPARGIGAKAVEALMGKAVAEKKTVWEILPEAASLGLPSNTLQGIADLQKLVATYQPQLERRTLVDTVNDLLDTISYKQELARIYTDPNEQQSRWNSVEEVVNAVGIYQQRAKKPTLGGFLDDVALGNRDDSEDKESKLARNAIVLMTLHSAKGLEYPHVYLVGMEENLLPHHRAVAADGAAIDEERRLCYVGVTRARDRLTLSLALQRTKWGKPRPSIPSRFLYELMGKADNPRQRVSKQPPAAAAKKPAAAKTAARPKKPAAKRR